MFLTTLHISNFRNIESAAIEFVSGFNYVYGANGAGKTAILESIHFLSRGRSFRTSRTTAMLRTGSDELVVRAEFMGKGGRIGDVAVSRTRQGVAQIRANGQAEQRLSVLARALPVQTLLPEAGQLVLGGPGERRGFLDWGLFHVEQRFLDLSRSYRRALSQRNAWLKAVDERDAVGPQQDPWLHQLVDLGARLSELRHAYVGELHGELKSVLERLAPSLNVAISYDWGGTDNSAEYAKKMSDSFVRDVKFGVTHRGPHRGDLVITVDGHPAADQVSRGQAKLIASAALLAQAQMLEQRTGTKCVFLIDDFGAELDSEHWKHFLSTLVGLKCQVIANSTEPLDTNQDWVQDLAECAVFHVEHGKLV